MGLATSGAAFCSAMQRAIAGLPRLINYVDDLVWATRRCEGQDPEVRHLADLEISFERFAEKDLQLSAAKTSFFRKQICCPASLLRRER